MNATARTQGFTLLEVIIAMAIMVLALSTILAVESGSIRAATRTKTMNTVAMLAKKKIVAVEQDFEGKTFDDYKKEDAGQFEAPYQDYSWEVKVKEIEFPSLASGGGGGSGGGSENTDQSDMVGKIITTFLSKALREVQVSVLWRSIGDKKQSFTLTTYWVDLNHEFSLAQ